MIPYEKEVVYVMRDTEGVITDVFDPKTSKYHKVTDTSIRINPSEQEKEVI